MSLSITYFKSIRIALTHHPDSVRHVSWLCPPHGDLLSSESDHMDAQGPQVPIFMPPSLQGAERPTLMPRSLLAKKCTSGLSASCLTT
mmetsp:Transcript_72207/g.127227  ORF Transcript_72207/g.127227 Transcript_72207/m.127227 type:complete len:88 (+) Transcript_72207:472-735(+)